MDEDNNDAPRVTRARTRRLSTLDTDSRSSTPLIDSTVERASPRLTRRTRLNSATTDLRTPTRSTRLSVARGETPEPITPSVSLSATKRTLKTPAKSVRKQLPLKEEVEVPEEDNEGKNNEASKTKVDVVTKEALDSSRNTSNSSDIMLTPKVTPPTDSGRVVTRSMSKTPPVSRSSMINIPQPQLDTNNSMEEKQIQAQKQTNNSSPVVEQQSMQSQQQSQSKSDDDLKKDIPIKAGLNNKAPVKLQVKVKNISMDTTDLQKITKEETQVEQQDSLPPDSQPMEISSTKLIEKSQEAADESQDTDKETSKILTEEEETPMPVQELAKEEDEAPMAIQEPTKTVSVTQVEPDTITDNEKKAESLLSEESKEPIALSVGDVLPDAKDVVIESPESQTEYITPMSIPETKLDDNTEQRNEQVVTDEKDVSMESCSDSQAEYETPKSIQEEKTNNNNKESVLNKPGHVEDKDNEVFEPAAATDKSMELPVDALPRKNRKSIVKIIDDLRLPSLTPDTKSRMIDKIQLDAKKVDFQGIAKADNDAKSKFPKTPFRPTTSPLTALNALHASRIDLTETPQKLIMLKKRNSSTPLAKPAEIADESSSVPSAPPQQIDVIKSLSDLEPKAAPIVHVTEKKLPRRLVSEDEEEEQEDEYAACEYFDNEVEVVDDYKSGDSMDSSERREIEENEIPDDGESVGSQDTVDDNLEDDEVGSLSSFIVSDEGDHDDDDKDSENDDDDDDKDSENDDDDDDKDIDIGELCFSSEDTSEDSDVKNNKKRRRIIVHESSEGEEQNEENNNKDKEHSVAESTKKQNNSIKEKKTNKLHQSIEKPKKNVETPIDDDGDMEVEEVSSSSEEDVEQSTGMRNKLSNKSIYEIPDSSDESHVENEDKSSTTTASNQQITDESGKQSSLNEETTSHEQNPTSLEYIASTGQETTSVEVDSAEVASPEMSSTEETALTEGEAAIPETVEQSPESENINKHNDDDAALLSEIASCDLSHLRKMFNPLQKSRRQTLYVQGPEMSGMEPKTKLKRRSEQFDSDFKPSQSFIETLAKETTQRLKRKHISKSFCGTIDDLDDSVVQEVQSKKPKKETAKVENVEPVDSKADNLEDQPSKPEKEAEKFADPTKDTGYYLNYCEGLLQRANAAALEQKKQRIATGKKPKSLIPTAAKVVIEDVKIPPKAAEIAEDTERIPKLKKNVKRLQATKQAVKHAMQLLGPNSANKEPQTLARKLSPQPQLEIKNAKTDVKKRLVKTKKPKAVAQVSPVKSSDEENHYSMKCIKTSAGYVVISKAENNRIELIKTRSGIMKVEPSTPAHKYFKEVPLTQRSRSGLSEIAVTSKAIKKKPISANHGNSTRNPATESALRFKKEIFGRSAK